MVLCLSKYINRRITAIVILPWRLNFLLPNRSQCGAYKLVNSLHGWVCLSLHRVEYGPAPFLPGNIHTKSVSTGHVIASHEPRWNFCNVPLLVLLTCVDMY